MKNAVIIAVQALKWFVGRQERGMVRSLLTVWYFRQVIGTAERALGEAVPFDFNVYDRMVKGVFNADPERLLDGFNALTQEEVGGS